VPYTGGKGIRGVLHNLILLFWKWIEDGYENIMLVKSIYFRNRKELVWEVPALKFCYFFFVTKISDTCVLSCITLIMSLVEFSKEKKDHIAVLLYCYYDVYSTNANRQCFSSLFFHGFGAFKMLMTTFFYCNSCFMIFIYLVIWLIGWVLVKSGSSISSQVWDLCLLKCISRQVDAVFFMEIYLATEIMSFSFLFCLKKSVSLEREDYARNGPFQSSVIFRLYGS